MKKISIFVALFVILSAGAWAQTPTPTAIPASLPTPYYVQCTDLLSGENCPSRPDNIGRPIKAVFGELQGIWTIFQVSHNVDGTIKASAIPTPTPAPTPEPTATPAPFEWKSNNLELNSYASDAPAPTPATPGNLMLFTRSFPEGQRALSRGGRPIPQAPTLFQVVNGIEKQIASLNYDEVNYRDYLDAKYLPDTVMQTTEYGTSATGTVLKSTVLRDIATGNEITALSVQDHISGNVVARLPNNVSDDVTATGIDAMFVKYNAGTWELWIHFQDGTEKLLADSVQPTPTPTPEPTATPTP